MEKFVLNSCSLEKMQEFIVEIGEKPFRAKQIFNWIHQKNVTNIDEMKNISKELKEKLKEKTEFKAIKMLHRLKSQEDETIKYLFEVHGKNVIESVFMKYKFGNSVCISSQAGCKMGCKFCASTLEGLESNLYASEMVSQIYEIQKDVGERISNIVIMGSGEPFDNYENFIEFLNIINSKDGLNIGQRHITVSTCGLVEKIIDLADRKTQINLAISLHAPNQEIRQQIMPVANKYDYSEVIKASKYFADTTKRRVTFEYSLIDGVNDTKECAIELASKVKGIMCHINLIPVNKVKERDFNKSSDKSIERFFSILKDKNIEVTVRRTLGNDINASCGQLRRSYSK